MSTTLNKIGTDRFHSYLQKHKNEVQNSSSENYYPENVVADAFSEGFNAGEESGKQDFLSKLIKKKIEELTQKANQVYILTNRMVDFLKKKNYSVDSFYISVFHENPKVIITVSNTLLIDDEFVDYAYSKVFELKRIFNDLFEGALDMGIMGSEFIDTESLINDGFEYSEDLRSNG